MDALTFLKNKYLLDFNQKLPIKLPINRFFGLAALFHDLGYKIGAEIGTDNGRYTKWLFLKNIGVKIYCIDPYLAYDDYIESHQINQEELNQHFENAKKRLVSFNVEFVRKPSMESVKDFKDNSLDFVFIDGNHTFQYVVNDIAEWEKKVRPGGIVSGHDYWRSYDSKKPVYVKNLTPLEKIKLVQVKDAIRGWAGANRINPWFVTKDNCWFYAK